MTLTIELLVIADCPNEAPAADAIRAALAEAGTEAGVTITIITDAEHARQRRFTGSPTDTFTQRQERDASAAAAKHEAPPG